MSCWWWSLVGFFVIEKHSAKMRLGLDLLVRNKCDNFLLSLPVNGRMDINESIVVAPAILVMGVSDPCRMRNTGDP